MLFIFRNHRFSHPRQAFLLVSLLLCLLMAAGCSGPYREDPRLRRAEEVLADPELPQERAVEMLDTLRAIPERGLSEGERHFRSFLMIKASDKGYIGHTSDSLYLTVKDYFSSRHREMLPEVLYYGGRIYSDMGVYPVALEHFEGVLDCLGDNPSELRLKRRVLSQTGRLLSKLGMYDQALVYIEDRMKLDSIVRDTLNRVYNLELAGGISTRLNDFHTARKYFEEACRLSKGKYPGEYAINRFRIGHTLYKIGKTHDALQIFRETIGDVGGMSKNLALAVAAQAYLSAGILDTARCYAQKLIYGNDILNKEIGYYVLLSDKLRPGLHPDTLADYMRNYNELLDQQRDNRMEEAAVIQNSIYNYSVHDREREKAQRESDRLKIKLLISLLIAMALLAAIVVHLFRKEKLKTRLYQAVNKLRVVKRNSLSSSSSVGGPASGSTDFSEEMLIENKNEKKNLAVVREHLIAEVLNLYEKEGLKNKEAILPDNILMSAEYSEIMKSLRENSSIEYKTELWESIRRIVEESYPEFMKNMRLLADGKLTLQDEQTVLLLKLGFRQIDLQTLLLKSKGGIGSRCKSIANKIFGEKGNAKLLIGVIKVL